MKTKVIDYIIKFLLGPQNEKFSQYISYGGDKGRVVIKKSGFFMPEIYMTENSLPKFPLKEIKGLPILFGDDTIEKKENKIILGADIIASSFFMITRYEEYVRSDNRDVHGRYLGKGSILYKAGCLERPLVDEYGRLLRACLVELGIPVITENRGYEHIYLTHDVDQIWQWRNLYSALKTMTKRIVLNKSNKTESIKAWFNYKKYDPIYTFPWFLKMDNIIRSLTHKCSCVYFVMGCGRSQRDFGYIDKVKEVKDFVNYVENNGGDIGIHISYEAGKAPENIEKEKERIERICNHGITLNRYHYLASRHPLELKYLVQYGISDDFTMGYADVAGFRLGTCRAVNWIDLKEEEITPLILHPMTVMEVSLDGSEYMGLTKEDAYKKVCVLLDSVYKYGGEVVLLWHNSTVAAASDGYQRELYEKTLLYIKSKIEN
ncbi:polysaccharide deacetylase family protein [[Clostridium] hylemonae]|uniref:polysaccharide deacetylase family protein n=1 Tax=[Clostridium] hylemonae TaxID=89153 RepID=UPI00110654EF|nr:polysaccharide deacetylase family protein [[Clostridium] hylemonae]